MAWKLHILYLFLYILVYLYIHIFYQRLNGYLIKNRKLYAKDTIHPTV